MYTFLLLLVTIIWGSTFFIIKDTVASVSEFFIVFGRTFIAAASMITFLLFKNRKSLLNIFSLKKGTILGFLMAIIYSSQTIGLKYTSSGHSAFVTGAAVIVVPILLYVFFKQKIKFITIISILIVFFGLFLLTYDLKTKINIGDLITLITAVSLAIHTILAGRFVRKTDVFALVTYQFLAASFFSFIAFIITGNNFVIPETKELSAIIYLGLIGTLVCYFITIWVQKYVSAIKVALAFSMEPVFAAIFGYFALNEVLNIKEFAGAFLILSGLTGYQAFTSLKKQK